MPQQSGIYLTYLFDNDSGRIMYDLGSVGVVTAELRILTYLLDTPSSPYDHQPRERAHSKYELC